MASSPDPLCAIVYVRAIVQLPKALVVTFLFVLWWKAVSETLHVRRRDCLPRKEAKSKWQNLEKTDILEQQCMVFKKLMNDIIPKTSLRGLCTLGDTADVVLLLGADKIHAMGSRNKQ